MYKLPLVVLLICSTVLCQAKPEENGGAHRLPAPQETIPHANGPSNSSHATAASAKEKEPVKDEHPTTHEKTPASSETAAPSTVSTTTGSPAETSTNKTSPTTSTTTTTTTTARTTTVTMPPTSSSTTEKPTSAPTTHAPPTHSPTTQPPPPSTTVHPKPHPDGGFNLPSFLGGMILGLGLLAIGYVIFKFYQTRRDSSYRTL